MKTWKACKTHLQVFMCEVLVVYVGRHSEIETGWADEGILQNPAPFSIILNHSWGGEKLKVTKQYQSRKVQVHKNKAFHDWERGAYIYGTYCTDIDTDLLYSSFYV